MAHGDEQRRGGELGPDSSRLDEQIAEVAPTSGDLTDVANDVALVSDTVDGLVLDDTVQALTPGAAVAFDASLGHVATLAMSTDATQTITISNLDSGESVTVKATQNAAGSKALVFASTYFAGGTEPTMTATAGAVDIYTVVKIGSQLYGFVAGQDLKS